MNEKKSVRLPKIRRVLVLADAQIPYQIDLTAVERFMADFRPDVLMYLGDMLDMTSLLRWQSTKPGDIDWEEIRSEIIIANTMLDRHREILAPMKKHVELHWFLGNHEERLYKFRQGYPEYVRKNRSVVPELVKDLRLKERGFQVHWQNDLWPIGKLHFTHGNNYSTHHAQKNLADYETNLCYGHVHSPQRHTKVARVSHSPKSAWSIGCLCSRNPEWKQDLPNAWVHGFAVGYIRDNGEFNLYPVDIIRGKFVGPNGRLY